MKFLLLFMFVAVALATEEDETNQRRMVDRLSTTFIITRAESAECIKKTGVKIEDLEYQEDSLDLPDSAITDMESLKRASCTLVCAAQKEGTMIGREINLSRFNEITEEGDIPENIKNNIRDAARVCKDEVSAQNEPDECMFGNRFFRCYHRKRNLPQDK